MTEKLPLSRGEVAAVRLCMRLNPLSLGPALEVEEHQHGLVIFLGVRKTGESTLGVKRLRLTKSIDSDITAAGLPLLVVPGLDEKENVREGPVLHHRDGGVDTKEGTA